MDGLSKDGSIHKTDERINTITALIGSLLAIVTGAMLIAALFKSGSEKWYQIVASLIYVAGYINLFVMSCLHHGLEVGRRANAVLRTLDYTAIFWLIAATLTVVVAYRFESAQGLAIVIATWIIAIIGITLQSAFVSLPKHVSNTLYITLGWLPALALVESISSLSNTELSLLIGGGLVYSGGFIMYSTEKPTIKPGFLGFHELWHISVLAAAFLHWLLLYTMVK